MSEGAKFILAPCQMSGDWKEAEQDEIALVGLQVFRYIYHREYSSLLFFPLLSHAPDFTLSKPVTLVWEP